MATMQLSNRSHHDHPDLTGEHPAGDMGQLIIAILFFVTWSMDVFYLRWTTFFNQYLPDVIRIIWGVVFCGGAGILARKGLVTVFGKPREIPTVIREGVFGIVRHPVYLSEILLYIGLLGFNLSLIACGILIGAIVFLHYIARYEEKLLVARFGDDYRRYMREVPMWIPRLRSGKTKRF